MDVRIEAAPFTASCTAAYAVATVVRQLLQKAFALIEQVASFSCPLLGSIAANAPNKTFTIGDIAWA